MIQQFNDSNVKQLRSEIESALRAIGAKYGLKVSGLGNIGYNLKTMHTGKLSFAVEASQTNVLNANPSDLLGKRFKAGSRTFTITGFSDGKYSARTNRGARYGITPAQLSEMVQL